MNLTLKINLTVHPSITLPLLLATLRACELI